jgi:cytochrome c oxidase subunit IV
MRRLIVAWIVLLSGNIGLGYFGAGVMYTSVHILIAAVMVLIILTVFKELDRRASLLRVFAGAGFFWLALLFILTGADYLTRYNFAPSRVGTIAPPVRSPH